MAWILGIGLAANGLLMLAVPADWYATVPGVTDTGPFNPHFIRDIGVAYLIAGVALPWFAMNRLALPAAQSGCGVPRLPRAGPPLGRRRRTRAPAPALRRHPHGVSAAGAGGLDRLAIFPRRQPNKGEQR